MKHLQDDMISWYQDSLQKFGIDDFRSITWGDKEGTAAKHRYEQMYSEYNWDMSSVFEIGAAWGSFFDFGYKCNEYYGIDINESLIDIAKSKYQFPNIKFELLDIHNVVANKKYDVVIASGVAGNIGGPSWHPTLLKKFLAKSFSLGNVVLINFPSNRATIRSINIEYYSPEYVIGQALDITNNVKLIHKNKFDFLLRLDNE